MTIGRYRLRQVIGRGGSSVVYRAATQHSSALPPVVAVKVAHNEQLPDGDFREQFQWQFEQQWRVSAAVDHPGVLPVFESGDDRGRPYLVMPHCRRRPRAPAQLADAADFGVAGAARPGRRWPRRNAPGRDPAPGRQTGECAGRAGAVGSAGPAASVGRAGSVGQGSARPRGSVSAGGRWLRCGAVGRFGYCFGYCGLVLGCAGGCSFG